jgi:[acyl-carrier-protein] S-malonyltransferase
LVEQVTGRVRWRECILAMKTAGVNSVIEIGHGKVLSGMTKRIDRDLTSSSIGLPEEITAFLEDL